MPKANRVAVLVDPTNPTTAESTLRDVEGAARAVGLQTQAFNVTTSREIDAAFASLMREWIDMLFVPAGSFFADNDVTHFDGVVDLSVLGLTPTLLVGTTQTPEPLDKPILNVSNLGLNNDGSVPISLMLTPTDPTLQNITSLAGNLHFDVTVLKLDDLPAVFDGPINIPLGSVPLFNPAPFPVAFQPQTQQFTVT